MPELRVTRDVGAPAQRVWDVVTDWDGQGRWIPLTSTKVVEQRADGVATRLDAWTGVGPVGFHDHMLVRVWSPPHRLVLDHVGRVVRGTAGFDIVPVTPELSRIVWWERVDAPLGRFGTVALRLVAPLLTLIFRSTIRRLAHIAESSAA